MQCGAHLVVLCGALHWPVLSRAVMLARPCARKLLSRELLRSAAPTCPDRRASSASFHAMSHTLRRVPWNIHTARLPRPDAVASPLQMREAELPPVADPRVPFEPPEPLDEAWVTDRRLQTREMLDWLGDSDRMPDTSAYLTRDAHQDTHAAAMDLLETALTRCIELKKTKRDPIGSPACWAVLLAQQTHANLHQRWEMDTAAGECKQPRFACHPMVSRELMLSGLHACSSRALARASDA